MFVKKSVNRVVFLCVLLLAAVAVVPVAAEALVHGMVPYLP